MFGTIGTIKATKRGPSYKRKVFKSERGIERGQQAQLWIVEKTSKKEVLRSWALFLCYFQAYTISKIRSKGEEEEKSVHSIEYEEKIKCHQPSF